MRKRQLMPIALLAFTVLTALPPAGAKPPPPRQSQTYLTAGPSARAKPWVPGWGFYPRAPQTWLRYQRHLARHKPAPIVFFGDSLMLEWADKGRGRDVWHERYAPLSAANAGIGGDTTRQALWRIERGELDRLRPRIVVLMIGTDNLNDPLSDGTDAEVSRGIAAVVHALRRRLPHTHILLLGLLPRQETSFCRRVAAINRPLAALDDGRTVRFLDLSPWFLAGPGRINRALYTSDQLHLTPPGYQTWAEAMQPLFSAMRTRSPRP